MSGLAVVLLSGGMASIGILTRRPDGAFTGTIPIKSYGGKVFLQPIPRTSENAPDFRLHGVGDRGNMFEAGAAWDPDARETRGYAIFRFGGDL